MDEFEMKKFFGSKTLEKSLKLFEKGSLSVVGNIGENITLYRVTDGKKSNEVLVRTFEDRDTLYNCDCFSKTCVHIATVMVKDMEKIQEIDDTETMESIMEDIENVCDDIISDYDYDEEANMYDDWEIEKYNLENNNGDVECEYFSSILERIFKEINDPRNMLIMITHLDNERSKLEYDNDGFDDALRKFKKDLESALTYIDAETFTKILKISTCSYGWFRNYMEEAPKECLDKAYESLKNDDECGTWATNQMFDRGDYDLYLKQSDNSSYAVSRVVKKLLDEGRKDEAYEYAKPLRDEKDAWGRLRYLDLLNKAGHKDVTSQEYIDAFNKDPCMDTMEKACSSITDEKKREEFIKKSLNTILKKKEYSISDLQGLLRYDHREKVIKYLADKNYNLTEWNGSHPNIYEQMSLVWSLTGDKEYECAANLAHKIVELCMCPNRPNDYSKGIDLLKELESDPEFEKLNPPHSVYFKKLREERKTMRKFWGMYDGTWVDKKDRNRIYYW